MTPSATLGARRDSNRRGRNRRQPIPDQEIAMAATASTRTSKKTSVESSASTETADGTHSDAVRELAVHATRIQLASFTALSRFFAGWAQSADRYVHAVSDELLGRVHGQTGSSELVGRLAAISSLHLREVTALPTEAVSHFNSELGRAAAPPCTRKTTGRPAATTSRKPHRT
jgi:hypothetical protein